MVIRMLTRLERRMDALSEDFKKYIENTKKRMRDEKYKRNERYTRENQQQIRGYRRKSDLEYRVMESTQDKQQEKKE